MDQRTFSAMMMMMLVLLAWTQWRKSMLPPPGDEIALHETELAEGPAPDPTTGPIANAEPVKPFVAPSDADVPIKEIGFEACGHTSVWNTATGSMSTVVLPEFKAAQQVDPFWSYVYYGGLGQDGFSGWRPYGPDPGPEIIASSKAQLLTMGSGALNSVSPRTRVVEHSDSTLVLAGMTPDGIEVTRRVTVRDADPCVLDVELTWTNRSSVAFSGGLWTGSHDEQVGSAGYYTNFVRPYAMYDGDVEWFDDPTDLEDEPVQRREGAVSWYGAADRYFMAALLPDKASEGQVFFNRRGTEALKLDGTAFVVDKTLAPNTSHTEKMRLYVGPLDYTKMSAVDEDLGYLVKYNYGWFAIFCFPLLWLLKFFFTVTGNWGVAIIALTMTMKALLFPLTQRAFQSSQAMQAIQPLMQEIREKYKDEPEKLNQETIKLFSENGVNPVGGCLPMIVQMPVWFALYRVLLSSFELYHTEFLYLKDLSVVDPYMAMPFIVVCAMLVQQQMMPTANMDPAQARMMKLMPLMFGFFFFTFPGGLVLYIFVNMILTILQQWLIRRQFEANTQEKATVAATT